MINLSKLFSDKKREKNIENIGDKQQKILRNYIQSIEKLRQKRLKDKAEIPTTNDSLYLYALESLIEKLQEIEKKKEDKITLINNLRYKICLYCLDEPHSGSEFDHLYKKMYRVQLQKLDEVLDILNTKTTSL